ncbi:nuclear cap-binding protein subunit 1 [Drosophila grimshawi]|uniref:Nuclear cap-binding protein subunit 1 n=1 Tax=Drosophila grimshawi TaxID=7222 RepID=B4JE26_DROGR|nr:nuclear cap-binding protein subunit 1 [Drosophila grimshawi]EDW03546.1 GH11294 [Drosophila grimshawi]
MDQNRRGRENSPNECEYMEMVQRPNKLLRRSDNKEVLSAVKVLMEKLSDHSTVSIQQRIEDLSRFVGDQFDVCRKEIIPILIECIDKRPMQSATYATFIGLINVRHYEFGGECLNGLHRQLLKSLQTAQWSRALSLLLLLADLVNANVLTAGSMLQLLGTLASVCEEEESPQQRRDFYGYMVLRTLPLIGRELYEKKETELQALLNRLLLSVKKQRSATVGVRLLLIWRNNKMPQHEYLQLLWQQILQLQRDNWTEQHLQRPYLTFDETLCTALQHRLPDLELPPDERALNLPYPRPWLIFRLFKVSDCLPSEQMPGELDIGRHIIELHILEILELWHLNVKNCADQLLEFCLAKPTVAMEHLIVEVLVGEMLRLPCSLYLTINYGSIIIELCRLRPNKFPRIVAHASYILFKHLEFMSVSSIDCFVNWFSHHLSNFRFEWIWQDWESCTRLPDMHPSAMFIRELLKKCLRLSYYQRILQMMPKSFQALMPVIPNSNYKYLNELLPGSMLAKALLEVIRAKCTPEQLGGLMEATTELDDELKVNVLMQTFLHLGCKTFTHINSMFSKFNSVLKMLASSDANQLSMLRALFEVWANNEQYKVVLADKLMKMQVVSTKVIVNWIFDAALKQELAKMYMWELLNLTVRFTKTHLRTCKEDREASMQNLLVHIVVSCVRVLSEHQATVQDVDTDYWYNWVQGRFQALLFKYIDDVRAISSKLRQIASELEHCKRLLNMIEDYLAYIQ